MKSLKQFVAESEDSTERLARMKHLRDHFKKHGVTFAYADRRTGKSTKHLVDYKAHYSSWQMNYGGLTRQNSADPRGTWLKRWHRAIKSYPHPERLSRHDKPGFVTLNTRD